MEGVFMKKFCAVLVLLALAGGAVFAEMTDGWWMRHPASVKDGGLMLTFGGGFGWGGGGMVALDYALPKTSFTLGGSLGFNYYSWNSSVRDINYSRLLFPLSFRFAWHPDLDVKQLDLYAMAGVSIVPSLYTQPVYNATKLKYQEDTTFDIFWPGIFSGGVGVRWFFTPSFAIWSEAGYLNVHFITLGVTLAL
jgi:hypothetical protein